ncbi:hypothetical protein L7F22_008382 [Adiantum nelumboides]|nr:hypothetical protein [Adiantum nelumboides]
MTDNNIDVFKMFVPEDRLDGDNHPMWAYMMQHVLVSKGVSNIVQDIDVRPISVDVAEVAGMLQVLLQGLLLLPIVSGLNGLLNSPPFRTYGPLLSSFVPVNLAILGCKILGMGAEKEIALAVSWSSAQLAVLAFVLKFVFEGERLISSILAISFMVVVDYAMVVQPVRRFPKKDGGLVVMEDQQAKKGVVVRPPCDDDELDPGSSLVEMDSTEVGQRHMLEGHGQKVDMQEVLYKPCCHDCLDDVDVVQREKPFVKEQDDLDVLEDEKHDMHAVELLRKVCASLLMGMLVDAVMHWAIGKVQESVEESSTLHGWEGGLVAPRSQHIFKERDSLEQMVENKESSHFIDEEEPAATMSKKKEDQREQGKEDEFSSSTSDTALGLPGVDDDAQSQITIGLNFEVVVNIDSDDMRADMLGIS